MKPYDNAEALLRVLAPARRNRFFYGKRMDVQHFSMEQDYGRLKRTLLNRLALGKGVLCGLRVSLDAGRLVVDPGVAIDGLGREVVVPVRTAVDLPKEGSAGGLFTVWACYRECSADFEPVLASDCNTRADCAAGTTIETFYLKVTPGLAPLQDDPQWCTQKHDGASIDPAPVPVPAPAPAPGQGPQPALPTSLLQAAESRGTPGLEAIRAALASSRHDLCAATSGASCDAAEGDPCVPLAALLVSDGFTVALDNCLVRPRVYGNTMLLDLILCLAQRIDECCGEAPTGALRVAAIDFVHRAANGESAVGSVASPRAPTSLRIGGRTNAVRITLTRAFARDAHRPTTADLGDQDFERHNVLVVPEQPVQDLRYVPGRLVYESANVVRFDLADHSPYSRGGELGWQKGRYRILLCGTDDAASGRPALTDRSGSPLDGEARAPAGGAMSGDGTPGGDFIATFVVG